MSRTARLKMLGNAVQVQCAELVGLAVAELLAATDYRASVPEDVSPDKERESFGA